MEFDTNMDLSHLTAEIGTLVRVLLSADSVYGYCLQELELRIAHETISFGHEHFGHGVILASQCSNAFLSVLEGDDQPFLPCFDDRESLELYTSANRTFYDLKVHSCIKANSGLRRLESGDLSISLTGQVAGDDTFISSADLSFDSNQIWDFDTYRRFELNLDPEDKLDEVAFVSITNTADDDLCVDVVSVNDEISRYISNHWIGTGTDAQSTSTLAVCDCLFCVCDCWTCDLITDRFSNILFARLRSPHSAWTTISLMPTATSPTSTPRAFRDSNAPTITVSSIRPARSLKATKRPRRRRCPFLSKARGMRRRRRSTRLGRTRPKQAGCPLPAVGV